MTRIDTAKRAAVKTLIAVVLATTAALGVAEVAEAADKLPRGAAVTGVGSGANATIAEINANANVRNQCASGQFDYSPDGSRTTHLRPDGWYNVFIRGYCF